MIGQAMAGGAMQDMLAQLEKLRREAAECELIRDLATDPKKRELFDRLAWPHYASTAICPFFRARLLFSDR